MEKLDLTTPNFTDENIQKLSELFPNCVTEDSNGKAIDFDALKQELSSNIIEGNKERYQLTWPGKAESLVTANTPINKTLRPVREESKDFDNTENLYIEGDNLEVLKLLQETYLGKIKMIYIDPPYNTGKDFVYKDNFTQDKAEYDEESGNVDDEGGRLVSNPDSNGRYHSDWLSMMYPRLKLARNLLQDDGVIFISIDDNEADNLKKICDEIFGESNLVESFFIQVRFANKTLTEKDNFQKLVERVLIYQKDRFTPNRPYSEYSVDKFCYEITEKTQGRVEIIGGKNVTIFNNGEYEIVKHKTGKIGLLKETWASGTVLKGNASGKYFDQHLSTRPKIDGYKILYKVEGIGADGIGFRYFSGPKEAKYTKGKFFSGVPLTRVEEMKKGSSRKYKPIKNLYDYSPDFGNISHEGGIAFKEGKKPTKMLKQFVDISTDDRSIILDFFSGSASTAHAVIEQNLFDHGSRKFIMVQLPERLKKGSDLNELGFDTITDVGKERIRRTGEKIKADNADKEGINNLDVGFRVLKVDSSNMKDVYFSPDNTSQDDMFDLASNIKDDRSDEDLLFMVLLDWGIDLSVKIERREVLGKTVYFADDNFLAACFADNIDENFVKAVVAEQPLKVVLRDSGFASSSVKINVEQIFKQADIEVKVI